MNRASQMTYAEAMARLVLLAKEHGGTLTAAQVEADELLSVDRDSVSAAARALAASTNAFSLDKPEDARGWFPFGSLVFNLKALDV